MTQFQKHFTLAEANAFLPRARRVLGVVQRFLSGEALPGIAASGQEKPGGGGGGGIGSGGEMGDLGGMGAHGERAESKDWVKWHSPESHKPAPQQLEIGEDTRRKAALELLKDEILDQGVVIQDLWRGLIDFPAVGRDGAEVLLCYELSDGDRIVAYHDLESGFGGRRPIEEFEEGM